VDAIIFDLRENGGGDPKMVAFFPPIYLNEPTHLNDLGAQGRTSRINIGLCPTCRENCSRQGRSTSSRRTTPFPAAKSRYNLKKLKRATLIGENHRGRRGIPSPAIASTTIHDRCALRPRHHPISKQLGRNRRRAGNQSSRHRRLNHPPKIGAGKADPK